MSSVGPFSRKANWLPSMFGSLGCEQRGIHLRWPWACAAGPARTRVLLRLWHCNRGDPLPPPELRCEKQVKLVRWEAGPNILLEGKRAHTRREGWGTPNLILKRGYRCSKILLCWDQNWSVKPPCTQHWSWAVSVSTLRSGVAPLRANMPTVCSCHRMGEESYGLSVHRR